MSNPSSQRCTPPTKTTQTERQPTRTEAHRERVPPQAISGSEADSMSRGGYPVTGRPHRSRLPLDTYLPTKPSFIRHRLSTKSSSPERHPTRTKAHRERGTPTGDFWKRSEQHEPRRVPGHGAPLIEVVFRWTHTFQRSRLSSGTGFQRSRPHQNDTRHEPKRTGSGVPPQALWERSGQHEPRRVPGRGAPPVEAVFHQAQAFNEAVFRQALPFLFSRWTCPT